MELEKSTDCAVNRGFPSLAVSEGQIVECMENVATRVSCGICLETRVYCRQQKRAIFVKREESMLCIILV